MKRAQAPIPGKNGGMKLKQMPVPKQTSPTSGMPTGGPVVFSGKGKGFGTKKGQ